MAAVTAALSRTPKLWRLGVSKNPAVGQAVWRSFVEALPQLRELQYLFPYENPSFGDAAARILTAVLPRCAPTLESIVLSGCNISAPVKAALRKAWGTERTDLEFSDEEENAITSR